MTALAQREAEPERDTSEPPKYTGPVHTVVGRFYQENTINELLCAALAVENLGFVPELRRNANANGIDLYVEDVPSMIGTLRASLDASSRKKKP